ALLRDQTVRGDTGAGPRRDRPVVARAASGPDREPARDLPGGPARRAAAQQRATRGGAPLSNPPRLVRSLVRGTRRQPQDQRRGPGEAHGGGGWGLGVCSAWPCRGACLTTGIEDRN